MLGKSSDNERSLAEKSSAFSLLFCNKIFPYQGVKSTFLALRSS